MTALKPIENLKVKGVASKRYPINHKCSHPNCNEEADDVHHVFPRSLIGNDSYFVMIEDNGNHVIIPHATGLCRNHHNDVELHEAWIKLEEDQFIWYDRIDPILGPHLNDKWDRIGPLNPQPGGREKIRKKNRRGKGSTETKRNRVVFAMRVPKDEQEDGAGLLEDAIAMLEEKLGYDPPRSKYYTIMDGLNLALLEASEVGD